MLTVLSVASAKYTNKFISYIGKRTRQIISKRDKKKVL